MREEGVGPGSGSGASDRSVRGARAGVAEGQAGGTGGREGGGYCGCVSVGRRGVGAGHLETRRFKHIPTSVMSVHEAPCQNQNPPLETKTSSRPVGRTKNSNRRESPTS